MVVFIMEMPAVSVIQDETTNVAGNICFFISITRRVAGAITKYMTDLTMSGLLVFIELDHTCAGPTTQVTIKSACCGQGHGLQDLQSFQKLSHIALRTRVVVLIFDVVA